MVLKKFLEKNGLPKTEKEIIRTLSSDKIKEIRSFVLGPGNVSNIPQACKQWLKRVGLESRGTLVEGRIPDEYLAAAQAVQEEGVVPLFWTCAVFGREKDLFFGDGVDTFMFFVSEIMPLDQMQLASQLHLNFSKVVNALVLPNSCERIASHKSPAPLLEDLLEQNPQCQWVEATSNGAAAQMCAAGEVDICITTETARREFGLVTIHDFGSPDMVFFGGLTAYGARVVRDAYATL